MSLVIDAGAVEVTVKDLIGETRDHLYGTHRAQYNELKAAVDGVAGADGTSMQVSFAHELRGIQPGVLLEIDDEQFYVWSSDASTSTATVRRAWNNTTPAAHVAGSLVEVAPRYPAHIIRRALRSEIRSWPVGIFTVRQVQIAATTTTRAYDLIQVDNSVAFILEVRRSKSAPFSNDGSLPMVDFSLMRTAPAVAGFPSQRAVVLNNALVEDCTLYVTYALARDTSSMRDDVDVINTIGVPSSATDIAPIGAAARLLFGREIQRDDTAAQGQPRNAAEVPAQAIITTAQKMKADRDARIANEVIRLKERWPFRIG